MNKSRIDITEKIFLEQTSVMGNTIISFNGNVGPDNLPQIESYFKKDVINQPGRAVILNLSSIKYLSSLVLGFFLKIYKELVKREREMRLVVSSKSLKELFIMTNINSVIPVFDTLEQALDYESNIDFKSGRIFCGNRGDGLTRPGSLDSKNLNSPGLNKYSDRPFLCEFKMEITSASLFIKIVREAVRITVTENYEITPEEEMDLLLCLGEAVNNSIKHGYHDHGQQGKVQIWVLYFADRIVVAVEDFGAGFDEEKILKKAAQAPENYSSASGRGIFIINSLMDHAIHKSDAKTSSTSIFIKFLKIKNDSDFLNLNNS